MPIKKKEEKQAEPTKKREISVFREYFEMIAEVLAFVFFINTFLLQSQAIPTSSMEDTMLIGDHLLVNKAAYSPYINQADRLPFPRADIKRGDIVTFKGPPEMEKDYVKRVIGLPGEAFRIKDKKVYINGQLLPEPYAYFKGDKSGFRFGDTFPLEAPRIIDALGTKSHLPFYLLRKDETGIDQERSREFCQRFEHCIQWNESRGVREFKIPAGHYFCMGDNRDNSHDSRFWGPLPAEYIIGQPWRVYWSYKSKTEEYLTPGVVHKIKDIGSTIVHFFSRTRWKRTFKKPE